ncbi:MAG: type II toxin-antitoxin system RelE/ParE family toxin [Alphaproteobacteria bacterium]|jgi:plasmid stabilization system protein ParE|nr:type II toxin-antitoxin system RelE/ParE family toxin [Alphaproteobacteria bacterium]
MNDVVWTENALRDLDAIGGYIALDDPRSAERIVGRIFEVTNHLSVFPEIGRKGRVPLTRELVIAGSPYIVVYRLREHVEILAIYHAARS